MSFLLQTSNLTIRILGTVCSRNKQKKSLWPNKIMNLILSIIPESHKQTSSVFKRALAIASVTCWGKERVPSTRKIPKLFFYWTRWRNITLHSTFLLGKMCIWLNAQISRVPFNEFWQVCKPVSLRSLSRCGTWLPLREFPQVLPRPFQRQRVLWCFSS